MSCQLSTPRVDSYKAFRSLWLLAMLYYAVRGIVKIGGLDVVGLPDSASALPQCVWVASWLVVAAAGVIGLEIPVLVHVASGGAVFLNAFIGFLFIWEETRMDVLMAFPYILMAAATLFTAVGLISSRRAPRG